MKLQVYLFIPKSLSVNCTLIATVQDKVDLSLNCQGSRVVDYYTMFSYYCTSSLLPKLIFDLVIQFLW